MDDPFEESENPLVKLTSLGVLGVGLAALFLGYGWFWVVFVVGFAAVVPIVKVLSESFGVGQTAEGATDSRPGKRRTARDRTADTDSERDALDALRSRYARGELSDAEFERKVEALLETETPESARKRAERETETATDR